MDSSRYKVDFVSVVVPVYNEEGCLAELIERTVTFNGNVFVYCEFGCCNIVNSIFF